MRDIPLNGMQKSGGRPYKSVAALRLSKLQRKRSTFARRKQFAYLQTAVHALQRYNTLHFQTESRVPTGRSRPYWMTQRKAGRAAFGSVPCGEPRFFCRSAHPDVRLIPAGGLVRQGRCAWVRFIIPFHPAHSETHSIR